MNGERDPTFLRCALQKPKERRNVLRLETELQRLRNSTAPSLEMQPMSAYNASLVEAVAAHFGLRVSSAAADPAAAGDEPLVRLTLLKTEASAASPPSSTSVVSPSLIDCPNLHSTFSSLCSSSIGCKNHSLLQLTTQWKP